MLEEGQLEEGELPSEVSDVEQQQERAGVAHAAAQAPDRAAAEAATSQHRSRSASPAPAAPAAAQHTVRRSSSEPPDRSGAQTAAASDLWQLRRQLDALSAGFASFRGVRADFEGDCVRLEAAVKLLDRLLRRVKAHKHDSVAQYPAALEASQRIADGAKHVTLLCSTGFGKLHSLEPAHRALRAIVLYRRAIFTPAACHEVEALLRDSRDFRYLLQQRDAEGRVPQAGAQAAAANGAGSARDAQQRAGSSGGEGGSAAKRRRLAGDDQRQQAQGGGDAAAEAAAAAAAAAAPAPEAEPEPPPPADGPAGEVQRGLEELLKARRLVLVLDLDHTLVNSAKFGEVTPEVEYQLQGMLADQIGLPSQELFRLPRVGMWTKLRPGARALLAAAAARFELWIHTAGSRSYALAVAELLGAHYFGARIVAQPDGADDAAVASVRKRLSEGLEGREPVAIILDDSAAAWHHDRRNLLLVERYVYLPTLRTLGSRTLMEAGRDECPHRGMLARVTQLLQQMHSQVFKLIAARAPQASWDVRAVLAARRREVLTGATLVFSRVIPLEQDPATHPLWRLALQYGAACSPALGPGTTHLVATHGGTDKVAWARQHGVHVVNPGWLECSCMLWQRADEARFPVP